jgi:DNA-binding transcriptional MerR regulator
LPSKLYFRIGEVAELVGVEPHVLRYWEREFRSVRPTKSAKGQRVYSRRDVENLMRVRELLYKEGFTIAGAKKRLQRSGVEPEREGGGDELADERSDESAQRQTEQTEQPEAESARASGVAPAQTAQADVTCDGHGHETKAREHLLAMRSDIERFLAELGPARR